MGKKYLDTKKNTLEDAVEQVWYQQHGLTNKETKEEQLHEVVTNYKQVAKDIKKKFQTQLKKKKFLTLDDIESYVTDNADSPHKVETDEIVKELGKLRITVAGKFPHKREEVEIEEALKTTHVLIDTSKNNEVIGAASDEKGIKQVYTDTARYTKKSVLKIVKLKKPASETKSGKLFGYPLHKWEEVELDEAFWKVNIPDMPSIFIEAGSAGVIKANLRKKLKGDAFKELKIEKVSRGDMIKKYREMAKGDSGEEESSESTIMDGVELDEVWRSNQSKKDKPGIDKQTKYVVVTRNMKSQDKVWKLEKDETLGKGYYLKLAQDWVKKLQKKDKYKQFEYKVAKKANINQRSGEIIPEQITSPSRYIDILNKLREETEYQKFFKSAMKKFGIKSPGELDGDKEKKFYDYVDKNWQGKNEPKEVGEKRKPGHNGKTLTGKSKDKIDVNPQTSDSNAGKY
jgi:hypothetical protein